VEDGRVRSIEPHSQNRATPEGPCLKGLSYVERANSPGRILYPLRKTAEGTFEQISTEEAIEIIAAKMQALKSRYGAQSILFYASSGTSGLINGNSSAFWKLFGGATTMYGNLCWPAGLEATLLTLGENKHNAPWDLAHARMIVMWGKNAAETNVQEMIPLHEALEHGATYVVIDPRRTQTSEHANMLIQPRPGTDGALALGVAAYLIAQNLIDRDFIDRYVKGFEAFADYARQFTLEHTAAITDVPQDFIRDLAEAMGRTKPLTILPGYGMQRYTNGGQSMRAILALQVITGNIGISGACWHYANLQSLIFDAVKEPVSYYPPEEPDGIFRRSISMARLGVDMQAAEDPPLKMVWVERGNPVTQNPDTNNVLKALRRLDFRVVVEQFMTDTAREADIILPAKNMFEQADIIGSYWNPYVQLKRKVVEPAGEVMPETEIYYRLAQTLGMPQAEIDKHLIAPTDEAVEAYLKSELARFPDISWQALQKGPVVASGHEAVAFADLKFPTPSGKIELWSDRARKDWGVDELPVFKTIVEHRGNSERYPLYLLTPNTKNRIHSQFGNLRIMKAIDPEPRLQMHPDDARVRGLADGQTARIFNNRGAIRLRVRYDYGIKRGCVASPNGWWISEGSGVNFLSAPRETDMGHGTAFHDNMVQVEAVLIPR